MKEKVVSTLRIFLYAMECTIWIRVYFCNRELEVFRSTESNKQGGNKTIKILLVKLSGPCMSSFLLHPTLGSNESVNLILGGNFCPHLGNHFLALFSYYRKLNLAKLHITFYPNRNTVVSVSADKMQGFLLCRLKKL